MLRTQRGFTLIELLVVIAIIAVLAAIIFPVFIQAKERAKMSACITNLRQIWSGMQMYNDDYNSLPPFLASLYKKYIPGNAVFICKSDPYKGKPPYWAPDWETYCGFSTVWNRPQLGCSYAYMPRCVFWYYSPFGPGLWENLGTSRVWASGNGTWVDSSKWRPHFDHWTPVVFDLWHAQNNKEYDMGKIQSATNQKGRVLVLIMGGSVKQCMHERQMPCQSGQIGNAKHPKQVLH